MRIEGNSGLVSGKASGMAVAAVVGGIEESQAITVCHGAHRFSRAPAGEWQSARRRVGSGMGRTKGG